MGCRVTSFLARVLNDKIVEIRLIDALSLVCALSKKGEIIKCGKQLNGKVSISMYI